MISEHLRARGIRDERTLAAMAAVPREQFVPPGAWARAYDDAPLPIEDGQSISQPYIVAQMTELLEVASGGLVLEIGTGSGYQAAVLAAMGARVRSIERLPALAARARARLAALGFGEAVEVIVADGSLGDPSQVTYDRIIVTAATPAVPGPLLEALAEDGRMVIPIGSPGYQEMTVVAKVAGRLETSAYGGCTFVPLIGAGVRTDVQDGRAPRGS
jgi:protein-L-isoaspartate(D-aspartate) O-methyltransferase